MMIDDAYFDKQHARIADLSRPSRAGGGKTKASLEEVLVLVARREPGVKIHFCLFVCLFVCLFLCPKQQKYEPGAA